MFPTLTFLTFLFTIQPKWNWFDEFNATPIGNAQLLKGNNMSHEIEYRIRIDTTDYEVHKQHITGREILELAKKLPPEQFELRKKIHGGKTEKIALTDVVDLAEPGIERFMTLPLDQQEG